MKNLNIKMSAANQPRIAVPTYAFGVSACARVDAPVRKHDAALFTGAPQGTTVWSPPPS